MQSIPVKVVSIAIIKIYVGISAIAASAKIKKSLLPAVPNPRHANDGTRTFPRDQPQITVHIATINNGHAAQLRVWSDTY